MSVDLQKKRELKKNNKVNWLSTRHTRFSAPVSVEVGPWAFLGVVCVLLSGGNVGGEMVQKEEAGGRKGPVWCRRF